MDRARHQGPGQPDSMSDKPVPLFPLGTVLFPRASLPLRIFEPRYKEMIQRCQEEDSQFGITLIQEGPEVGGVALPHPVGCLARIKKADHKANGDIHVVVEGTQRFRVTQELRREPTWLAQVELLEDPVGDDQDAASAREELRSTLSRYANIYFLLTSKQLFYEKHLKDPVRLSWFLADLVDAENPDKQALLEDPDAVTRLSRELGLLDQQNQRLVEFWGEHKFSHN